MEAPLGQPFSSTGASFQAPASASTSTSVMAAESPTLRRLERLQGFGGGNSAWRGAVGRWLSRSLAGWRVSSLARLSLWWWERIRGRSRALVTEHGHTIDSDGDDDPIGHCALNPEIPSWQQAADQSIQYRSEQHREFGLEYWSGLVDLLGPKDSARRLQRSNTHMDYA